MRRRVILNTFEIVSGAIAPAGTIPGERSGFGYITATALSRPEGRRRGEAAHEDVADDHGGEPGQEQGGDEAARPIAGDPACLWPVDVLRRHRAYATRGTRRAVFLTRAGLVAGAPVGTTMPQAPSSAPSSSSRASSRSGSNVPGSASSPVFLAEKPKRP